MFDTTLKIKLNSKFGNADALWILNNSSNNSSISLLVSDFWIPTVDVFFKWAVNAL